MHSKTFIMICNNEGLVEVIAYDRIATDTRDFIDVFFSRVSKYYAFEDCSGDNVINIYWRGKKIEYVGWQPNMVFEYKDVNGNIVWSGQFENWDH